MKLLFILFLYCCLPAFSFAYPATNDQVGVLRGTVNVALGNEFGLVIAADALLSGGAHPKFAQKLFQIDDRSVCTIAGFYSTDDPNGLQFFQEPESSMHLEIRAVIHYFSEQLKTHSGLTIQEKTQALAFLISTSLERLVSLDSARDPGTRLLQGGQNSAFLIAGYNPDGSSELAKASLRFDGNGKMTAGEASVTPVESDLVWNTAGIDYQAIPVLREASKSKSRGASLSTGQMVAVAKKAILESSNAHSSVIGGEAQFAVLKGGKVFELHQHGFQDPPLPHASQMMFAGVTFKTLPGGILNDRPFGFYGTGLYIGDSFEHVSVTLDSSFFARNSLTDCNVFYDGSPFKFERNNKVTNCSLLLGPHADPTSPDLLLLLRNFEWKEVSLATIPSNYPHW